MELLLSADETRRIEEYSMDMGVPVLVLMERAALGVADKVRSIVKAGDKVLVISGVGNNGADGLVVARLLSAWNISVDVAVVGDEAKATPQFMHQKNILKFYGIAPVRYDNIRIDEYNILVDAMIGIGLSKELRGAVREIADDCNKSSAKIVAVDIPTGINADSGEVMGCCVRADYTVTFGYKKVGQFMYPGKEFCGEVSLVDVGFLPCDARGVYIFDEAFTSYIPERRKRSNKGTYGKPLIIAGSGDMTGAAFMSAMAAYRSGSGVVTVLTQETCDEYLKSVLPEAIVKSYSADNVGERAKELVSCASTVVLGPGIGTDSVSEELVHTVISECQKPLVIDADALNILSKHLDWFSLIKAPAVITPHPGEMARLTGKSIGDVSKNLIGTATSFAQEYGVYCVLKDAVSVVASPDERVFFTTAGNPGMATAGSGDVLTGVLAAVFDMKKWDDMFLPVCLSANLHGAAGDLAAQKVGEHSLMARDIIDALVDVFRGE